MGDGLWPLLKKTNRALSQLKLKIQAIKNQRRSAGFSNPWKSSEESKGRKRRKTGNEKGVSQASFFYLLADISAMGLRPEDHGESVACCLRRKRT